MLDRVILPACSKLSGKPITQVTAILDMKGVGMTDLMSKNVYNMTNLASKMIQEYFPEVVFKTYIINTPMLFSGFFSLVKPLLNSRTQATLSMPGGKFKKELADAIPLENLPVEYGGTSPYKPDQGVDQGDYVEYVQRAIRERDWDVVQHKKPVVQTLSPADSTPVEAGQQSGGQIEAKAAIKAEVQVKGDDAKTVAGVKQADVVEANDGDKSADVLVKDQETKADEVAPAKAYDETELPAEEKVSEADIEKVEQEKKPEEKKNEALESKPEQKKE